MKQNAAVFFAVLFAFSSAQGAVPPSERTEEELLWHKLSAAAAADVNGKETSDLMNAFVKKFPENPRVANIHYMQAEQSFKTGDYKNAAARFESFLTQFPQSALGDSASFRLGECYYNLKAYNSAQTAWEGMVKRTPQSALIPDAMEYLTVLRMRANEWGKASELMKKLKAKAPDFADQPRVREKEGVILFNESEYMDSAKVLEGLDRDMSAYYRGLSLFSLKLYEDSVGALSAIAADKTGAFVESAAFLKAEGFFQKKNYNVAASEFKAYLTRFPASDLAPYANLRIAACALLTGDPTGAAAVADKIVRAKTPLEVETYALFIKAWGLTDQKNFEDSAYIFGKVSERTEFPNLAADALVRKAWAHKNLGQIPAFEKSLKTLEEKYPSAPQMALGRFLLGAQLFETAQWDEAGSRFETAVMRHGYSVLSEAGLALMAISYTRAKQPDQLVTAAHAALKILEGNYSSASPYWRAQSNYFIGRAYTEMNKYKDAIPFLEKVGIEYADHALAPPSELLLAWCFVETGKYDKAREKADRLIEGKKTDKDIVINAKFLKAASHFNAKEYDKALASLSDFLKDHPSDSLAPESRYLMGLSYHQKTVYGSAIEEWTKVITDYPDHALAKDAYLYIADLYFKAGKFDESAKFFKKFNERWPNTKYTEIAAWQELQSYFNGKSDEAAIVAYPVFIEKFPNSDNKVDAEKQLEMIYYRRGEHGDPAKLEEFLAKYPKSPFAPSARFKLGDMAIEQKKWNRTVQEMEQFVRDYPKDPLAIEALYALGQAYENLNEPEKAAVQYKNIMDQFATKPASVDAAFRLGMLHFGKERYQEAVDAFNFAAKKKMKDEIRANLYYNLALCYENLGQLENAAAAYGQFANITKNPEQGREALMTAGLLLKKAEKPAPAANYFTRLLKDPGTNEVQLQTVNLLAESYKAAGNVPKAMQTYEKLVGMEPASSDLRLAGLAQLAFLYEEKKQLDKAMRVYEKITVSDGKAEWVKAAKDRVDALNKNLNAVP